MSSESDVRVQPGGGICVHVIHRYF